MCDGLLISNKFYIKQVKDEKLNLAEDRKVITIIINLFLIEKN